jgi:hypothetical protein
MHIATDLDGEFLVLAAEGRLARPEPMALPQPLPALRRAEKPTAPAARAICGSPRRFRSRPLSLSRPPRRQMPSAAT